MDWNTLAELDRTLVWHPFTQAQTAPPAVPVRSAQGAVLTDEAGREILDLISSWWVTLHGHGQPAIARAIGDQALRLEQVIFAGFTHEPAVELSRRLTALLPAGLRRCFFSDNGSTAVEVALKMALQSCGNRGEARDRFIAFDGGYHGDTVGAMSVGVSSKFFEAWRKLLFPVDVLPMADTWLDDEAVEAKEAAALAALDRHLERFGARTAAAVIEPLVQGACGMHMHRASFLRGVVERLRAKGILVICDEVMTGFGRTGPLFACLEAQVRPDFICLSQGPHRRRAPHEPDRDDGGHPPGIPGRGHGQGVPPRTLLHRQPPGLRSGPGLPGPAARAWVRPGPGGDRAAAPHGPGPGGGGQPARGQAAGPGHHRGLRRTGEDPVLDGQPVEVETTVDVIFKLSR